MSANSRGVPVLNRVNTLVSPGVPLAFIIIAIVAASSAFGPALARSWTIILKPPPVPMPRTGGGAMTRTLAASTWLSDLRRSPRIEAPVWWWLLRSVKLSSARNIVAAFGAFEKLAPSSPAMLTMWLTPGTLSARATVSWRTASVRSSVDPGGIWMTPIR